MIDRLVVLSAALTLLVLTGCGAKEAPAATAATAESPEAAEASEAPATPATPAHVVPELSLPDLRTTEEVDLKDTKGRVVLLDFWATWCQPCAKSLPVYETWQTELGPQGFAVVAVSVDSAGSPVLEHADRLAPSIQVLLDPGGLAPKAMKLPGLPVAFLVGRDGVVRSRHVGFHTADAEALEADIIALLAEPAP